MIVLPLILRDTQPDWTFSNKIAKQAQTTGGTMAHNTRSLDLRKPSEVTVGLSSLRLSSMLRLTLHALHIGPARSSTTLKNFITLRLGRTLLRFSHLLPCSHTQGHVTSTPLGISQVLGTARRRLEARHLPHHHDGWMSLAGRPVKINSGIWVEATHRQRHQ